MNEKEFSEAVLHDAKVRLGLAEERYLRACGWHSTRTGWFHSESVGALLPGVIVSRPIAVHNQEVHDSRAPLSAVASTIGISSGR